MSTVLFDNPGPRIRARHRVFTVVALLVFAALLTFALWQLWSEARPSRFLLHSSDGAAYIPPPAEQDRAAAEQDVFIITERQTPPAG